jgi:hypothetical protein
MAIDLLKRGKKVIILGRSEDTLSSVSNEIGATGYYVLDTGDVSSISPFISKITTDLLFFGYLVQWLARLWKLPSNPQLSNPNKLGSTASAGARSHV